jgi:hypothetical protein
MKRRPQQAGAAGAVGGDRRATLDALRAALREPPGPLNNFRCGELLERLRPDDSYGTRWLEEVLKEVAAARPKGLSAATLYRMIRLAEAFAGKKAELRGLEASKVKLEVIVRILAVKDERVRRRLFQEAGGGLSAREVMLRIDEVAGFRRARVPKKKEDKQPEDKQQEDDAGHPSPALRRLANLGRSLSEALQQALDGGALARLGELGAREVNRYPVSAAAGAECLFRELRRQAAGAARILNEIRPRLRRLLQEAAREQEGS